MPLSERHWCRRRGTAAINEAGYIDARLFNAGIRERKRRHAGPLDAAMAGARSD